MIGQFSREKKFTELEDNNPCEQARKIWNERDGYLVAQNNTLRKVIVGLLIVTVSLTAGLVVQSTKSSVAPYIIEVDSTTGMARNVGTVEEQAYKPQEAEIKYFLSEFIKNTREIPLDPVVYKQKWNKAYTFLTRNSAEKMNAEMQIENPAQYLGKKTVQVNIVVVVPMSENSYQVRWTEEEFTIGSGKKKSKTMTGIFTVIIATPKDEDTLKTNPLGIYFTDFNWSKEAPGQ